MEGTTEITLWTAKEMRNVFHAMLDRSECTLSEKCGIQKFLEELDRIEQGDPLYGDDV